jgi:hypothetical protein
LRGGLSTKLRNSGRKAWGGLHRELGYRPFLALLALGVLVRVAVMAMYSPAWMQSFDELRFARIDPSGVFSGIFSDYWMPAGYAVFARGLREIIPALWVSIAAMHLIGLTIGVAVYLALRRLGARPWLACIPAAVPLLSGDELWIEHQIMSEAYVTALVAAGLACCVRGLVPKVNLRWIAAGSALLTFAGLSRNVALITVPILVLCVAFWARGSRRESAWSLIAATVPALLLFAIYVGAFEITNGRYLGIDDMSGWNLYARIAPFADCSRFTPRPGTRRLCESTPSSQRDGSLGYQWDENSIGRRSYPPEPRTGQIMGEFAEQVILHEPLSYLKPWQPMQPATSNRTLGRTALFLDNRTTSSPSV